MVFTNFRIYQDIVEEHYAIMAEDSKEHHIPREDGSGGFLNIYDPKRVGFKSAMIVIVFVGMWLESLIHLRIVQKHGVQTFEKVDRGEYAVKLGLIGISTSNLLERISSFRKSRKTIEHEKAYTDKEISIAQEDAMEAYQVMHLIMKEIGES